MKHRFEVERDQAANRYFFLVLDERGEAIHRSQPIYQSAESADQAAIRWIKENLSG